jgi:hypothetical protein
VFLLIVAAALLLYGRKQTESEELG